MNFQDYAGFIKNGAGKYIIAKEHCEAFFENDVFYEDAFCDFLCENKEEIEDLEQENNAGSFFYKNMYFKFWKENDEFIICYDGEIR